MGFPTATDDDLSSEQWTIGPAATWWNFGKEWVFGSVFQTFFSYAGEDSDRPSTNALDFQYFLLYNIPNTDWKIGMTPNFQYDFKQDDMNLLVGLGATSTVKI